MGKRKTKIVDGFEIDEQVEVAPGDAATAVLDRRRYDNKSSQLDWVRLAKGYRDGQNIPPDLAAEVAEDCGYTGDAWTNLINDSRDLSAHLKGKKFSDPQVAFEQKHGNLKTLLEQEKAIKENLASLQKLIKEARLNKDIANNVVGSATRARNNRRLFPDRNETLISEAGIS